MGQVCSGATSEPRKATGFEVTSGENDIFADTPNETPLQPESVSPNQPNDLHDDQIMRRTNSEEGERIKKLREEQARLDMIVTTAGRGMVSVRSTRGSTGYYDQGFAAALAQHLEQTTTFPETLPIELPSPSTTDSLYNRLTQESTVNNPPIDSVAESLLDTIIPGKQHLFARAHPIVENLM